jgi:hypothetical protein
MTEWVALEADELSAFLSRDWQILAFAAGMR